MSGFDTSQPITDEKSLEDVAAGGQSDKADSSASDAESAAPAQPDELGDATPGPR
ncbi:MAG: hypothetical protein QOJ80_6706 [Mycobacterium sp.]|nr:hypothetical protein [Mycobacterium sp.]